MPLKNNLRVYRKYKNQKITSLCNFILIGQWRIIICYDWIEALASLLNDFPLSALLGNNSPQKFFLWLIDIKSVPNWIDNVIS